MTTHWIIAIGSPKLRVMAGKPILTAVSSGTTDIPSPIITRRMAWPEAACGRSAMSCAAGGKGGLVRLGIACSAHHIPPGGVAGRLLAPALSRKHLGDSGPGNIGASLCITWKTHLPIQLRRSSWRKFDLGSAKLKDDSTTNARY